MVQNLFSQAPEGPTVVEKYDDAKERAKMSNRARQARHREKKDATMKDIRDSIEVLVNALAEAGCAKLVRGLDPMEPGNAIKTLAERIASGDGRLIYAKKEAPGARADRRRRQVAKAREIAGGKKAA